MKWFQKPPKPAFNKNHPDVKHLVEVAFKAGGKTYYRFIDEKQIPTGRYKYIYAHLKEVDMRMNIDTLKAYIKDFKTVLNGAGPKKIIEIGELWKLVYNLETRISLAFEPATVERLAAVIYFDDTEELSTYNRKYGEKKIDHWRKHNVLDFFLTKPIGELLGLSGISIPFLEDSIQQIQEELQILTSDQQTQSSANSSENGKAPSSS